MWRRMAGQFQLNYGMSRRSSRRNERNDDNPFGRHRWMLSITPIPMGLVCRWETNDNKEGMRLRERRKDDEMASKVGDLEKGEKK